MKRTQGFRLVVSLGLIVFGMVAFGTSPAKAQTVAPGPYYATPSWNQTLVCTTLANCPRFIVLSNMNSAAVLDRETGLVWERSPSTVQQGWKAAQMSCNTLALGNRKGWRLPTLQELASLVDPSQSNPALPAGHPFSNVQFAEVSGGHYYSATTADSDDAWAVHFKIGIVDQGSKIFGAQVWCVRGGQGVDPQ